MNADLIVALIVGPVVIVGGLLWAALAAIREGIDGRDKK